MDEQRAEFEAWAHKTHYNLGVGPNGLYQSGNTSSAWASWHAATQRQQERIAAIKRLLARDPCAHANTAIQMIDAAIAQQKGASHE